MRSLHNIEPSGFHKDRYIGYANGGVWRICRRPGRRWEAIHHSGEQPTQAAFLVFSRPTLRECSEHLERVR